MLNSQLTTYNRRLRMLSVFVVSFWLLVVGQAAHAAVMVEVDTGTKTINAIEGVLVLPLGASVGEIHTGNSAILIWIAKPAFNRESSTITFSGFTPGGFRGKYPVFSLNGVGLEEVRGASFSNVRGYLNDGSGTEVNVTLRLVPAETLVDDAPPEPFAPIISSSPDLFEGRDFISFATQDKGTGVGRYEYASTWLLNPNNEDWQVTEAPRVLTAIEKFKRLHIRAVDYAENVQRVSTVGPYRHALILIGTIMIVCVLLFLRRSFHSPSSLPSSSP